MGFLSLADGLLEQDLGALCTAPDLAARPFRIARRELVHAQASDVVHALGPDPSARLPQCEDGALRVLQHGNAVDDEDVERIVGPCDGSR